jgi:hypothetical protein
MEKLKLKQFDAYAKPLDDFRIKTHTGAVISLTSAIIAFLLIISEYLEYTAIHTNSELMVDINRRERLNINMNITFNRIPCGFIGIDVMDVSGEQQNGVHHRF